MDKVVKPKLNLKKDRLINLIIKIKEPSLKYAKTKKFFQEYRIKQQEMMIVQNN